MFKKDVKPFELILSFGVTFWENVKVFYLKANVQTQHGGRMRQQICMYSINSYNTLFTLLTDPTAANTMTEKHLFVLQRGDVKEVGLCFSWLTLSPLAATV